MTTYNDNTRLFLDKFTYYNDKYRYFYNKWRLTATTDAYFGRNYDQQQQISAIFRLNNVLLRLLYDYF